MQGRRNMKIRKRKRPAPKTDKNIKKRRDDAEQIKITNKSCTLQGSRNTKGRTRKKLAVKK